MKNAAYSLYCAISSGSTDIQQMIVKAMNNESEEPETTGCVGRKFFARVVCFL